MATEEEVQNWLERKLKIQQAEFTREYRTPKGTRIDFYVTRLGHIGHPFGIEVKPNLAPYNTRASDWANHLEQCLNYVEELRAPVFLGPFANHLTPFHIASGSGGYDDDDGRKISVVSAFCLFGGRRDVGLLYYRRPMRFLPNGELCLLMRGQIIWRSVPYEHGAKKPLLSVASAGSNHLRSI